MRPARGSGSTRWDARSAVSAVALLSSGGGLHWCRRLRHHTSRPRRTLSHTPPKQCSDPPLPHLHTLVQHPNQELARRKGCSRDNSNVPPARYLKSTLRATLPLCRVGGTGRCRNELKTRTGKPNGDLQAITGSDTAITAMNVSQQAPTGPNFG